MNSHQRGEAMVAVMLVMMLAVWMASGHMNQSHMMGMGHDGHGSQQTTQSPAPAASAPHAQH